MKKLMLGLCVLLFHVQAIQAAAVSQPLMESDVFHLINQKRVAHGLKPLKWHSSPAHLARQHSLDMANGVVPFGHQGADQRFAAMRQAIPSLTSFGENVAYNSGFSNPAQTAVTDWMNSPGHYANIMGDFNLSGVGVAKNAKGEYYFTQIFGKATLASSEESAEQSACVSDNPVQWSME